MLEPYGAGNNRPLFCLMGATLERLQSVGQNRHLKLRLSKGSSQFDGIFFSVSPDTCPVAAGSRVDAAFYLQINEFRGNRTVQLQMVDIRPSLTVSTREDECLHLLERCLRGDRLLPKEAVHLLPSRSQCVQLWRALEHTVPRRDSPPATCRCCGSCPPGWRGPTPSFGLPSVWRCSGNGSC
ncbi:MAG: hypothetical protein ACLR01_13295 [Vescimonas sp.]